MDNLQRLRLVHSFVCIGSIGFQQQMRVTAAKTKHGNTCVAAVIAGFIGPSMQFCWQIFALNKPLGEDIGADKLILGGSRPERMAKIIFMIPGMPAAVSKWPKLDFAEPISGTADPRVCPRRSAPSRRVRPYPRAACRWHGIQSLRYWRAECVCRTIEARSKACTWPLLLGLNTNWPLPSFDKPMPLTTA